MKGGSGYKINRNAYLPLEALQQRRYLLAQILEHGGAGQETAIGEGKRRETFVKASRKNSFEFSDDCH